MIDARAEKAGIAVTVFCAAVAKILSDFVFRFTRLNRQRPPEKDVIGQVRVEPLERIETAGREHFSTVVFGFREITQSALLFPC
jgi:hypothetical protein